MQEFKNYLQEINNLAHTLEKLSKVINHSDPTAESKKRELFSKYKYRVQEIGRSLKNNFHWEEVKKQIEGYQQEITVSKDLRNTILRKILSDLEQEFIEKHVLTEFAQPTKQLRRKKNKKRSPVVKRDVPEIKPEDRVFTRDSLMEMVKLTTKQREARTKLQNLIDKINNLNPDKLEDRIKKYLKEGKR